MLEHGRCQYWLRVLGRDDREAMVSAPIWADAVSLK